MSAYGCPSAPYLTPDNRRVSPRTDFCTAVVIAMALVASRSAVSPETERSLDSDRVQDNGDRARVRMDFAAPSDRIGTRIDA